MKLDDNHKAAALFLSDMLRRSRIHADRLDPKGRRQYGADPLLAALDKCMAAAKHAISTPDAAAYLATLHHDI
jgi:hypothetical protein